MPPTVRVAVVPSYVAPSLSDGLSRTREFAERAVADGAALVVFPETWLPGYPAWLDWCRDAGLWNHAPTKAVFAHMAHESIDVDGDSGEVLSHVARDVGVTMVIGVTERVSHGVGRGTLFNTLLTYGPDGALLNHHRKLIPTYTERLVWGHGDTAGLRAVDTPVGRVSGLVCWEHWMPLARQALHDSGEDIHVAAWPMVHEMHQVASRQYAFEGRCFVIAAGALMRASALPATLERDGRATHPDTWILRGGSAIIGPDGSYVTEPVYEREALIIADIDLARIREEQMTLDVSGHYSRPDAFDFSVRGSTRRAND